MDWGEFTCSPGTWTTYEEMVRLGRGRRTEERKISERRAWGCIITPPALYILTMSLNK